MLTGNDLYNLAKSRFVEAKCLLVNHRPDGAVYLCGYAVELILKRHIARALDWDGYPETNAEFQDYKSFKVHNLDVLLRLSGLEKKVTSDTTILARWQITKAWNSEIRYKTIGKLSESDARDTINATRDIINFILGLSR